MTAPTRALLIGINYFGTSHELGGCVNDVLEMHKYLARCGCRDITVLVDTKSPTKYSAQFNPTHDNIVKHMRAAVAATKAGETLYVHYSGHGSHVRDLDGDETDGRDECICPVDNRFIIDDDLRRILVDALATGAKLRCCFDACHSGSAIDLPYRWLSAQTTFQESKPTTTPKDVIFISGCKDVQTSADAWLDGASGGAMTWAFIKSLEEFSAAVIQDFTWKDLISSMRRLLYGKGFDQVPQLSAAVPDHMNQRVDLLAPHQPRSMDEVLDRQIKQADIAKRSSSAKAVHPL